MKKAFLNLIKDDSGMESVEVALSIALIAAIAGFGMIVLGTNLSTFFSSTGSQITGNTMPTQPAQTL